MSRGSGLDCFPDKPSATFKKKWMYQWCPLQPCAHSTWSGPCVYWKNEHSISFISHLERIDGSWILGVELLTRNNITRCRKNLISKRCRRVLLHVIKLCYSAPFATLNMWSYSINPVWGTRMLIMEGTLRLSSIAVESKCLSSYTNSRQKRYNPRNLPYPPSLQLPFEWNPTVTFPRSTGLSKSLSSFLASDPRSLPSRTRFLLPLQPHASPCCGKTIECQVRFDLSGFLLSFPWLQLQRKMISCLQLG